MIPVIPGVARQTETANKIIYIGSIIADIFGFGNLIYLPSTDHEDYVPGVYQGVKFISEGEAGQLSSFGTPVFGSFSFEAGEYNGYDNDGRVIRIQMNEWQLPYSCVVEFSRPAVLTQTRTLGSTGTVKELYGLDDWQISIRGVALNDRIFDNQPSAQEQIDELVRWGRICDSIPVVGAVFNRKDINNITIKNISIQPIEGRYNVIPFEIQAASDEPIELII